MSCEWLSRVEMQEAIVFPLIGLLFVFGFVNELRGPWGIFYSPSDQTWAVLFGF